MRRLSHVGRRRVALSTLALAGLLSGCISLFPKEHPVQLYRFTDVTPPAPTPVPTAGAGVARGSFTVRAAVGAFDRASASDRILTVEGDKTAYISDARWVASAQSLFESALTDSFGAAGPARLLTRGELTAADYRLDVTVRRFETRYEAGPHAPPVVVVTINASLDSDGGPATRRERTFTARTEASADRVGPIVAAYDQSVGEVLGKLRTWVAAKGAD